MPKNDKLQPLQLNRSLPGTNCKKCGVPSCLAFAFGLIAREKKPEECPDLLIEKYKPTMDMLKEYLGGDASVEKTGVMINKDKCIGCGDCVIACIKCQGTILFGSGTIIPRDVPNVYKIVDGVVEVANWASCKRCADRPELCRICEERCPTGALELVR